MIGNQKENGQRQYESPYAQTVEMYRGNMPIIMTVPHDGSQRTAGDILLAPAFTIVSNQRKRDTGMRYVMAAIRETTREQSNGRSVPTTFFLRTRRSCRTPEIQSYFVQQVIQTLRYLSRDPQARMPLFLDFHGFCRQPDFPDADGEPFDIILGTGHRRYVRPTDMDEAFGSFLRRRGYHVYIPGDYPRLGELFTAYEEPRDGQFLPLTQVVHAAGLPAIPMQVEIASQYRINKEAFEAKGKKLAADVSAFLLGYA